MLVLGVDPSLTGTGLCLLQTGAEPRWWVHTIKSKPDTKPLDPYRATWRRMTKIGWDLADWAHPILRGMDAPMPDIDLIVLEGPAFSKNNGMAHERAGLWWQLYGALTGYGCPVLVVKPNVRAKYATGRGNAGKDEVMLAASRRYAAAAITNNNEADAVVLAAMGARGQQEPVEEKLPAAHQAAMKTVAPVS